MDLLCQDFEGDTRIDVFYKHLLTSMKEREPRTSLLFKPLEFAQLRPTGSFIYFRSSNWLLHQQKISRKELAKHRS